MLRKGIEGSLSREVGPRQRRQQRLKEESNSIIMTSVGEDTCGIVTRGGRGASRRRKKKKTI